METTGTGKDKSRENINIGTDKTPVDVQHSINRYLEEVQEEEEEFATKGLGAFTDLGVSDGS